ACQGYYGNPPGRSTSTTILRGNGDGTFSRRVDYPANGLQINVAVGDFNGDGLPDFAVANYVNGNPYTDFSSSVRLNYGGAVFPVRQDLNADAFQPWGIAAADFDGDGDLDIATANINGRSVSILKNASASATGLVYLDADRSCSQNGAGESGVTGKYV